MNPTVVILANDTARFQTFAAHLEKSGYPTRCLSAAPGEDIDPSTIFFVSFNLRSEPAPDLAKTLEQTYACIVFAEDTGTQNAAKLGSAKFAQTLQHPYTEKNFVMAVQTIVKKRKAQFDKDERKRLHDEKMKARQKPGDAPTDHGLIIQEAPEAFAAEGAMVFKGEAPTEFFIVQESANRVNAGRFDLMAPAAPKTFAEITLSLERGNPDPSPSPRPRSTTEADAPVAASVAPIPSAERPAAPPAQPERTMSQFWAVFGMCLVGSAICLYCVYQVLFNM